MISTPQAPAAPDPTKVAAAQTTSNAETATAQAALNNVNQVTPYGNLSYTSTPSGTTAGGVNIPQYTATQTLSPAEQKLFDLNSQTQANVGQIGVDQSAKVGALLNTPFDLNAATGSQQFDISKSLLDPTWAARNSQLETSLANQGIQVGSEAYTNAQRDFGMQRDNAYNSAMLADRGQATTEALAQRNQPLNEISALMSGSQVSQPSFVNPSQTTMAPTDVVGAYNNATTAANQQYAQQMGQTNAIYGALGSAAGTVGGMAMGGWGKSDRRMKRDIQQVGTTFKGTPIYAYRWMDEPVMQLGLMAQDVEKIVPEAVREFDGIKMVNYELALTEV